MRALAGVLLGILAISVIATTARAQPAPQPWIDTELIDALDASGLLDEWAATSLTRDSLNFLVVEGDSYETERRTLIDLLGREQQAVAMWASTAADRTLTEQELRALVTDEGKARLHIEELEQSIVNAEIARARIQAEVTATETALLEIAVTRYMGGRLATELQTIRDAEPVEKEFSRSTILDATDDSYNDQLAALRKEMLAIDVEIARRIQSRDDTVNALIEIGSMQLLAADSLQSMGAEVSTLESGSGDLLGQAIDMLPALHRQRVTATVPQLDFSLIAFDAYIAAADLMADADEECQVDWATIASIGNIESVHGTLGGRYIAANGNLSRPLLGVLLDGGSSNSEDGEPSGNGFLTVPDSDYGALDGSAEYDRALGPMQFLPSTWRSSGVDGNADGVNDPQNIHDAASSAANYLCVVAREVKSGDLADRLRGYNDSSAYVQKVLSVADELRVAMNGMEPLFD